MNYELYMSAALAEAAASTAAGEQPDGAVAVVDEAMIAHGRPGMHSTGDPTAHAVMRAIRETARRLGRPSRSFGVTRFAGHGLSIAPWPAGARASAAPA